jgi:hypothetical protein
MLTPILLNSKGQGLAELLIAIALLATLTSGVGWVFKREWQRERCAYFVFERTHAALIGSNEVRNPDWTSEMMELAQGHPIVRIQDSPEQVRGTGQCQGLTETVLLPKLEAEEK